MIRRAYSAGRDGRAGTGTRRIEEVLTRLMNFPSSSHGHYLVLSSSRVSEGTTHRCGEFADHHDDYRAKTRSGRRCKPEATMLLYASPSVRPTTTLQSLPESSSEFGLEPVVRGMSRANGAVLAMMGPSSERDGVSLPGSTMKTARGPTTRPPSSAQPIEGPFRVFFR